MTILQLILYHYSLNSQMLHLYFNTSITFIRDVRFFVKAFNQRDMGPSSQLSVFLSSSKKSVSFIFLSVTVGQETEEGSTINIYRYAFNLLLKYVFNRSKTAFTLSHITVDQRPGFLTFVLSSCYIGYMFISGYRFPILKLD